MATKIRLQRHGRKRYAFYPIVVADSRAPRDGRFIERIGSYNPNTNPATISLDFDRALYWVETGAQPTDTVRSILSKEGVMLMKHLRGGVKKGAFTEEEAQRRFDAWKADRNKVADAAKAKEDAKAAEEAKARFDAEAEKNRLKGEAVAKKKAEKLAAEEAAAKAALEAFMNSYRMTEGTTFSTKASALEDVVNEIWIQKRIELWGEGLLWFDYKRRELAVEKGYIGTNHPALYRYNTYPEAVAPWMNIYIVDRVRDLNQMVILNPDPTGAIKTLWTE